MSDLNVTNSVVAGEIAVLRSNLLLGRVVDDLGLMSHPDFDPYLVNESNWFGRSSERALSRLDQTDVDAATAEPMPETQVDPVTGLSARDARNIVIWQVRRDLTAYQSGISYVINISMKAHDPEVAAEIANAVADRYIQDQLGAKLAATQRAIAWLDNRLIELETQLREAEDVVVEFLAQQVIEEGGDKESVEQQLVEMNRAIVVARNDRAAADARLTYVRSLMTESGPEGAASALDTARLTRLDDELATLEREQAQLATRLGPRHPQMLALQLALEDVRRDRVSAIRAGIAELEATVAQAVSREGAIADEILAAQLLQVDLSRSSVRLSQLERSASAMRQVYESFLARFQETTQQLEFQRPDARIITQAQPALAPARPRRMLILAVALTLGALLGTAVALIREVVDRSLRTPQELAAVVGLPVLGVLPKVWPRGMPWQHETSWQHTHLRSRQVSRYGEGLRLLQMALCDKNGVMPATLLITGSEKGAGASTTALGLARVTTGVGNRVALVDANWRRPALEKMLGTHTGVDPDLTLFEAEPDTNFEELLKELVKSHDTVIIDAPSVTVLADAIDLAPMVDTTVLVARNSWSRVANVIGAVDMLKRSGAQIAGTVLSHGVGRPVSTTARTQLHRQLEAEWSKNG